MLLKTRVTVYNDQFRESIKLWLTDHTLAQNVTDEQRGLSGDFVLVPEGETARYLAEVKRLQNAFGCGTVVEVG